MGYDVRLTTDKVELHAFLQRDPIWAAYAIGDLEPAHFSWCTWHIAEDAAGRLAGLALLYRRLDPPVLLTVGEPVALAAILQQMALPQRIYISARQEHLPLLLALYDFSADRVRPMLRMAVTAESFKPASTLSGPEPALRRLDSPDIPAIEALIALGGPFAPDAFSPAQVAEGVFYGIELASVGLPVLDATPRPCWLWPARIWWRRPGALRPSATSTSTRPGALRPSATSTSTRPGAAAATAPRSAAPSHLTCSNAATWSS